MRACLIGAAALALGLYAGSVSAEFSGTVAATSDYDYRGFSQTAGDPALQGSVDFELESGFYASLWGSSLDWGDDSDAEVELDWIAGFTREIGSSGVSWDAGLLFYHYPGLRSANFLEFYGGFSWRYFNIKLSYSDDFAGVGASAWYLDGGLSYEWANGLGVFAYGGYSFGDAFDEEEGLAFGSPEYWNYGFGAGYSAGEYLYFELKGVGTDLDNGFDIHHGEFQNDFRIIASVTVSFLGSP